MLDLPDHPFLDKHVLVGGCVRLPLALDAERFKAEVTALPVSVWGSTGGRVGVHMAAEAIFLRGHAPAQGNLPIEDRAELALLPYPRSIIQDLIGARPMRCLLARMPPDSVIAPHIDRAPYFSKTLRLHFPVESHDQAWMLCAGLGYLMRPGEVWVLNNTAEHAVWNAHLSLPRTHMICDFLPDAGLLDLLARGDRGLGKPMPEVEARVRSAPPGHRMAGG
ncbi:MAG: aspartyl/asparaginyl beta-hydroxylase domain-containing protein [Gammaproteobacteria bacterium]